MTRTELLLPPYYQDDFVTLYHGDSREILPLLHAEVLLTDPPYGIAHQKMGTNKGRHFEKVGTSITGDADTSVRDAVLEAWGDRPGLVFGSMQAPAPRDVRQVLVWHKDEGGAGIIGACRGWRRDWEAVYVTGAWPTIRATDSSVMSFGGNRFESAATGHPHTKPVALMRYLATKLPEGRILDPFAGSGSTLRAAKDLGRRAIGIEVDEKWCKVAAERCAQEVFDVA